MLLRILLNAETPLSFRTGRNPARSETLSYIPGTSIIGGLAQAHQWLECDSTEFASFFLKERVLFGNCYPAGFSASQLTGDDRPVLPIPLTARSCKRFSGFKFNVETEEELRAGVTDALIPLALFARSHEQKPELLKPLERHSETDYPHSETDYPLDRINGFYRRGAKADYIGQPDQRMSIRTRTGINYRTGAVRSEILYSRQTIAEGSSFWGCWWIDDDLWESFKTFLDQATPQGLVRIGNNRTRGFGRVSLNAQTFDADTVETLRTRIEDFTAMFKATSAAADIDAPHAAYVPITLISDMVLYDPLLRARLRMHADDLIDIPGAELIFQVANSRQIAGWSALWGLPKADDWAIGMGSVFLFALPRVDDSTFTALLQLQQRGIGERRAEGFGMISVANLFHTELAGEFR